MERKRERDEKREMERDRYMESARDERVCVIFPLSSRRFFSLY